MTAERNLLDAARRHGIAVPKGLEALLSKARRAGATLTSIRVDLIRVDWGKRGPPAAMVKPLADHLLAHSPYSDSAWDWEARLPLGGVFPVYHGQDALKMFVELCSSLEFQAMVAVQWAIDTGLATTLSFRRTGLSHPPFAPAHVYAVLDVDVPNKEYAKAPYAFTLANGGFVRVDGSSALRTACEVAAQ